MSGLPSISSNFDVNDWLNITAGNDASCVSEGEGKLRFICDAGTQEMLRYDDPIVYPRRPGRAHLHHFFGNTLANHRSTYRSLRTTGDGTCSGGPINRTAYWYPAIIKPAGPGFPVAKVVKPAFIELYYQTNPAHLADFDTPSTNPAHAPITFGVQGFPNGFEFIWGWPDDGAGTPQGVWGREDTSGGSGLPTALRDRSFGTLAELAAAYPSDNISGAGYRDNISARTNSPGCWDGTNLTSANGRSHVAYGIQDGFGNLICPATHPYRIPQLTLIVGLSHNGPSDFSTWYLSSDRHDGENYNGGHTFHTDWKGAWDNTIQTGYEFNMLAIGRAPGDVKSNSSGILCFDNKQLDPTFLEYSALPLNGYGSRHRSEATRYLDIPAQPPHRKYSDVTFSA